MTDEKYLKSYHIHTMNYDFILRQAIHPVYFCPSVTPLSR